MEKVVLECIGKKNPYVLADGIAFGFITAPDDVVDHTCICDFLFWSIVPFFLDKHNGFPGADVPGNHDRHLFGR
jgi:hypothetical protein